MVTSDAAAAQNVEHRSARRVRALVAGTGLAAASALVIGLGIGPADALNGVGPWARNGSPAPTEDHSGSPPACAERPAEPPTTTTTVAAAPGGNGVSQVVTVVVPPIVRVLDDSNGVLTIVTNAARPPAPGDQVVVRLGDGSYEYADPTVVTRVLDARWDDTPWCSTTAEHRSTTAQVGEGDDDGSTG